MTQPASVEILRELKQGELTAIISSERRKMVVVLFLGSDEEVLDDAKRAMTTLFRENPKTLASYLCRTEKCTWEAVKYHVEDYKIAIFCSQNAGTITKLIASKTTNGTISDAMQYINQNKPKELFAGNARTLNGTPPPAPVETQPKAIQGPSRSVGPTSGGRLFSELESGKLESMLQTDRGLIVVAFVAPDPKADVMLTRADITFREKIGDDVKLVKFYYARHDKCFEDAVKYHAGERFIAFACFLNGTFQYTSANDSVPETIESVVEWIEANKTKGYYSSGGHKLGNDDVHPAVNWLDEVKNNSRISWEKLKNDLESLHYSPEEIQLVRTQRLKTVDECKIYLESHRKMMLNKLTEEQRNVFQKLLPEIIEWNTLFKAVQCSASTSEEEIITNFCLIQEGQEIPTQKPPVKSDVNNTPKIILDDTAKLTTNEEIEAEVDRLIAELDGKRMPPHISICSHKKSVQVVSTPQSSPIRTAAPAPAPAPAPSTVTAPVAAPVTAPAPATTPAPATVTPAPAGVKLFRIGFKIDGKRSTKQFPPGVTYGELIPRLKADGNVPASATVALKYMNTNCYITEAPDAPVPDKVMFEVELLK